MAECLQLGSPDLAAWLAMAVWAGLAGVMLWVRRQSHFFGKGYFLIAHLAMLVWLFAVVMELLSNDLDCKVGWAFVAWPAIVLVPTAWAFFLLDYGYGRPTAGKGWKVLFASGGPVLIGLIVVTNPLHGLFYGDATRLAVIAGRPSVIYDHGPLFWAVAAYLYAFLACGLIITASGVFRTERRFRGFFLSLFAITAIPVSANLAYLATGFTVFGFDPTPFFFALSLFLLTRTIFANRLMDITNIAKDLLFYNTGDPILIFDATGGLAGANPEARRLFAGRLPEIGQDIRALDRIGQIAAEAILWQGNIPAQALAIAGRHFDIRLTAIEKPLDRSRPVMGWILTLIDVTERRFLSTALLAERDYLSKLMDTSMSGIVALDAGGRFVFANSEAERIIGLGLAQLQERPFFDPCWQVTPGEDADGPSGLDRPETMLSLSEPQRNLRFWFLRPDGQRRMISLNSAPVDHPDMTARVVLALADVTEQHRAEDDLRQAVERAEAASRTKSQFLANMSHEIRTPLNGVLGMAEVLDRAVADPEHKRMVATIRRSGELLLTILNDVLDMSKIEAGKLDLMNEPFRPDALAARIEELHSQSAEEKALDFDVFTSGATDLARIGDAHRVTQILQNLVSNAIKFTPKGEVTVTFACPRGKPMQIEVRDTGIGMTAEQAERVFEAFEQADGSVTRRFGGTGLGMSIVRHLTVMMGGEIDLQTSPGKGTVVRVSLPLPEARTA